MEAKNSIKIEKVVLLLTYFYKVQYYHEIRSLLVANNYLHVTIKSISIIFSTFSIEIWNIIR